MGGYSTGGSGGGGSLSFSDRQELSATGNSNGSAIIVVLDTNPAVTVTLRTEDCIEGSTIIVKDESGGAGSNPITIATQGAETIDEEDSVELSVDFGVIRFYSDGTNWFTF